MKTKLFILSMVFMAICNFMNAVEWPTKIVNVEPDQGVSLGALGLAIEANGSAIYVLKRGGTYLTNGQYTIPAAAGTLIIRAEEGTGPRPIIMGGVPSSGYSASERVIIISSDIKFENIYFTGEDMNGVVHKNTIRVNSGSWFEFIGCMFDKDNAASIRNESQNCAYTFYNCTFRNQVDYTSLNNGRGFDARDAKQHLGLVMKNCTFYNLSKQVIRTSTSEFDSIIFVNNTCFNVQVGLSLGRAKRAVVNNNIFYNFGLQGYEDATSGMLIIDTISAAADADRTFDFRNNLFYTDPQYQAIMVAPVDTSRYLLGLLNVNAKAFLKKGQVIISDTIKNQSLEFSNPAPLILGFVQYQWQNYWPTSFTPTENQRLEAMEDPLNFGDVIPPTLPFSFAYSTSSPAYTAGLNGEILGDKKWFGLATAIENPGRGLSGNVKTYFNQYTKTLNVIFDGSDAISFNIRVFGLDGKQLSNRSFNTFGQARTQIEMNELSKGMYIYVIEGKAVNGIRSRTAGKVVL